MGSVALGAAGPRTATPISPRPPPGEGSGGNFFPQLCGTPHLIVNPRLHRPLAGDRQIKLAFGSILSQNAARAAGKKCASIFCHKVLHKVPPCKMSTSCAKVLHKVPLLVIL